MSDKRGQTECALIGHYQTYPELQIEDVFKFLYQSSFGCEHLVTDSDAVIENINNEAAVCRLHIGELTEPLDGDFCRVHLGWVKAGLSSETMGKLFVHSAVSIKNGKELLEEKLSIFLEMVSTGLLPFTEDEVKKEIAQWRVAGYPACHHSERYRSNYFPAYRVIKKEYAMFLPLLLEIDRILQIGEVTLAIEGGSASGKTTLSKILEKVYGATVFHMDDFFLQPKQRTLERFAQPGGNVDWERFLDEVLVPLRKKDSINYRRFDCSTFTIKPAVIMNSSRVNIIEGAYSMHPELLEHYNLSVFLNISSQLQKKRIRKRNTPEMAERFFNEWIPMEHLYFEKMHVKERCDVVIDIGY